MADVMFGNSASEQFFIDTTLLITAGFFILVVGIIIGFYVESLFNSNHWKRKTTKASISYTEEENGNTDSAVLNTIPSKVPKHIAVIMDGNRRFGREKLADPLQGHWSGGQTLVDFVQWCIDDGVKVVTVYAFSTENWNRDPIEVHTLMSIFAKYAETFKTEALSRNVKVNVLSTETNRLPAHVQEAIRQLQQATAGCTAFTVNICLSYGARGEIVNAMREISKNVVSGSIKLSDINEDRINSHLCTANCPDPDIMIRTSGEYRVSNFLLWQMAYTEMFFLDKYWPQLTKVDYRRVLHQYANRNRRYGI